MSCICNVGISEKRFQDDKVLTIFLVQLSSNYILTQCAQPWNIINQLSVTQKKFNASYNQIFKQNLFSSNKAKVYFYLVDCENPIKKIESQKCLSN